MKKKFLYMLTSITIGVAACQSGAHNKHSEQRSDFKEGTFGYDLNFLNDRDSLVVLKSGSSQVIISPKYQGKVFTSTADGRDGKSFGWINYKAFDKEPDPHMNGYGGENRLWLGPEGGKYSIFFKKGLEMTYDNWHTPAAFDTEAWELKSSTERAASLSKNMKLENYQGTILDIRIERDISIMEAEELEKRLGINLTEKIKAVGFKTSNVIINIGKNSWTEKTGAPCIWVLDMFAPSPNTTIVIPYQEQANGAIANTDYFGQISADRMRYENGVLYFKADGKSRGKLGIPPLRSKPLAGSYDAVNKVLTITMFDVEPQRTYLNQEWTNKKDPLIGDAVNAYNDGPLEDGTQMGPFYEIESASPAAFLEPGERMNHNHTVFHFTGSAVDLDPICKKSLGVSLKEIDSAFNK